MKTKYSELDTLYICWMRRNLRIHDNILLTESSQSSCYLIPLYIIDPAQICKHLMGINRLRFLVDSLHDLDSNLNATFNQRLFITYGPPLSIIQNIIFHIKGKLKFKGKIIIGIEKDYQPYEKVRDSTITQWAEEEGIMIQYGTTQTLWNLNFLGKINMFKAPNSFKNFKEIISNINEPSLDQSEPESLPPPLNELFENNIPNSTIKKMFGSVSFFDRAPSVDQLGMGYKSKNSQTLYKGGETNALKILEIFIGNLQNLKKFDSKSDNPTKNNQLSSNLSPYISLGCLSIRKFYYNLKMLERFFNNSNQDEGVNTIKNLLNSLIYREYFYMIGCFTTNFDKMYDNPVSKLTECWDYNTRYIEAWKQGTTGYPAVDAVIQQLIQDGWINDLKRQFIAHFLTKGTLWQSWEIGLNIFQKYQIDFDWVINTGSWIFLVNSDWNKNNTKVKLI